MLELEVDLANTDDCDSLDDVDSFFMFPNYSPQIAPTIPCKSLELEQTLLGESLAVALLTEPTPNNIYQGGCSGCQAG